MPHKKHQKQSSDRYELISCSETGSISSYVCTDPSESCSSSKYCCCSGTDKCNSSDCSYSSSYSSEDSKCYNTSCKTPKQCLTEIRQVQQQPQIMTTQEPSSMVVNQNRRSFRAIASPISDLSTPRSPGNPGSILFTSRKYANGVVTLQFEPYRARIAGPTSYISINQSIGDLPPHTIDVPYVLKINGDGRVGFIRVDPLDGSANLKFYLGPNENTNVNSGDLFETNGGIIQWIESY